MRNGGGTEIDRDRKTIAGDETARGRDDDREGRLARLGSRE
jgi:hypothetical protein